MAIVSARCTSCGAGIQVDDAAAPLSSPA